MAACPRKEADDKELMSMVLSALMFTGCAGISNNNQTNTCRSGRRSKEISDKLVKLGYTNIVGFGGIPDWKGEITID